MDYTKEIKEMLTTVILSEPAFKNENIDDVIQTLLDAMHTNYSDLSAQIQIGVDNGYTLKWQLCLFGEVVRAKLT